MSREIHNVVPHNSEDTEKTLKIYYVQYLYNVNFNFNCCLFFCFFDQRSVNYFLWTFGFYVVKVSENSIFVCFSLTPWSSINLSPISLWVLWSFLSPKKLRHFGTSINLVPLRQTKWGVCSNCCLNEDKANNTLALFENYLRINNILATLMCTGNINFTPEPLVYKNQWI